MVVVVKFPKKSTSSFKWVLSVMMIILIFFQFKLGECNDKQISLKTKAINEFVQANIYSSRINTGLSQAEREEYQGQARSSELEQRAYALRNPRDIHIQQGNADNRDANNMNCSSWRNTSLLFIASMFILTLLNKKGDA